MPKPAEYLWIAKWGQHLGSSKDYIVAEQQRAAADNAPVTAIFKRGDEWRTTDGITNPQTRFVLGLDPIKEGA